MKKVFAGIIGFVVGVTTTVAGAFIVMGWNMATNKEFANGVSETFEKL